MLHLGCFGFLRTCLDWPCTDVLHVIAIAMVEVPPQRQLVVQFLELFGLAESAARKSFHPETFLSVCDW